MSIRAFIAISLTKEIQNKILKIQEQLKESQADVKWVEPENIHLTLKFLGNVEEKKIEEIKEILEKISEEYEKFSMELLKIGAFPKLSNPRVIWISIEKGKEELQKIFLDLEEGLNKIGFKREERGFSAHITIGRVRSPLNRSELLERIKRIDFERMDLLVGKITLFKSTLTPKGPIYESLYEANLK